MATTHANERTRPTTSPYNRDEPDVPFTWIDRVRRVSWGGIFAGLFAALSAQMLLSVLGLTIGVWTIEPTAEAAPLAGLGTGAGIWWIVTGLISLLLGGWVAGRASGIPNACDGMVHGLVCWGLLNMIAFWAVGSTVGTVLSGTASALGQALDATGAAVTDQARSPQQARAGGGGAAGGTALNINYEAIGNELRDALNEADKQALKPENLEQAGQKVVQTSKEAAAQALKNPDTARHQLDRVIEAFVSQYRDAKQAVDQQALVNVITENSDLSEGEAEKMVSNWKDEYQEAKKRFDIEEQELKQEARETAREVKQEVKETAGEVKAEAVETADQVTDALATAGLWTFLTMLAGLLAALGGGAWGARSKPNDPAEFDR